ncbi:hypothetical protein CG419_03880 [Latilactobacillus curvatus]|uniref:Uncharacterized protein n=1 Tax=Latilactobacillus curvatus TaxID=28038 RepID=A0AAC9UQR4_LATCU|nr:hypothetical protein [Latilactobacillus curvatus]ASN59814.1 hypothetical protein CG419_03880 [Latilactobacillus curvatus]
MSFYTEELMISKMFPNFTRIDTIATDYLGDQMVFTRDGDHFSDDGYFYNELEMIYPSKAKRICEAIARNNFCKFEDEAFVCDNQNHDEAVMALIKCGIAVGSCIQLIKMSK